MGEIAAAAPVQPLAQALITIVPGAPPTLKIHGHGFSQASYASAGHYALQFDAGLIGIAGAIEPLPIPPQVLPIDPNVRTNIMPLGLGFLPLSGIFGIAFAYVVSPVNGVGAIIIDIVLTNAAFILEDPLGLAFEIVVWKGLGGGPVP
jgi:hypothetical protein